MVKSVLGVNHQGLTDWIIQRVSAIYMAIFSIWLIAYIISHASLTYQVWHDLFARMSMKVASLLFIFLLLYHAWIGVWTILTDYVKPVVLRSILDILVLFMLAGSFIWSLLILWSV